MEVHRIDRRDHPLQITDLKAPEHARRFQRFESTAAITPVPANPFDPAQIDVEGVFNVSFTRIIDAGWCTDTSR